MPHSLPESESPVSSNQPAAPRQPSPRLDERESGSRDRAGRRDAPASATAGRESASSLSLHDRWKQVKRHARYVLLRLLTAGIEAQPVSRIPRMQKLLLQVAPFFFQGQVKRAYELLPAEFADRAEAIIDRMGANQMLNFLEIVLYEKILQEHPDFISVEGWNVIDKALARGKGVIILSGHFGNWELVAYTLARRGLPLNVIARPQAVNRMTEFMNSFRERRGVKVLMDENLRLSLRLLKENKLVGIVSDLDARDRGYRVPFFGRPASFYPTPVLLSVRTGAALIPTFIERRGFNRQHIRFESPIAWEEGETVIQRIRKYVERYEHAFRRRPDQWVWFHERYRGADLGRTE